MNSPLALPMDPVWTSYGSPMDPTFGPLRDPLWTPYGPTMDPYGLLWTTMDPLWTLMNHY